MITKRARFLLAAALSGTVTLVVPFARAAAAPASAKALLREALRAQGGEMQLRAIRSIEWHAVGWRNELEQSERPEGPFIIEDDLVSEAHDQATGRFSSVTNAAVYPDFSFVQGLRADRDVAVASSAQGKLTPSPFGLEVARETLALSPERLLLTALDARDVVLDQTEILQAVPQDVIRFSLDGAPVRVFLNRYTHLPTAVDYSGPLARNGYWRFLGDVQMRTLYSSWAMGTAGIHLPMQWNIVRNGLPDSAYVIRDLKVNASLDEEQFAVPAELRSAFRTTPLKTLDDLPLGTAGNPPRLIAPGIMLISGSWNVTLVRQKDGIVVIEAPISSGYSAKVLDLAQRTFPGLPVKAVVSTSDSWPHIAGIREYAARGIPIYCLDLNRPILTRLIDAPYSSRPDRLQRSPRAPRFVTVNHRMPLGQGENALELIPIRGETSERQMMAWFPQAHLLYGSDPFQSGPGGAYSTPQTVTELTDAVQREGLRPTRFFMMHIEPRQWSSLSEAIAQAKREPWPGWPPSS